MPDGAANLFIRWLDALWSITAESGWYLVFGFLLAGVVHAFVPMAFIRRHLSGRAPDGADGRDLSARNLGAIVKGAIIGAPLPLCSCSVIPAAAGLRRAGASRGATTSFAVGTPETGVDSISITYALLGPAMTLARPLAAILTAVVAGVLVELVGRDGTTRAEESSPTSSCCASRASKPCCASETMAPVASNTVSGSRALRALRYGWLELPKDLALWLVVGLALSAAIAVLVPPEWLGRLADSPWSLALMLLAGLPLYVCATSSTPIAAALIAQGLSPGAGLVFLLAGPASNIATMAWVLKDLGARALIAYIVAIGGMSLLAGWLMNALLPSAPIRAFAERVHEHAHSPLALAGGVAVAALLIIGLVARFMPRRSASRACCAAE